MVHSLTPVSVAALLADKSKAWGKRSARQISECPLGTLDLENFSAVGRHQAKVQHLMPYAADK